ncbi:Serine carboxypeptidase S10 family member 1-like [Oopsacas minuta]|uniref:Carboxypeptidase n=1 Tax=Oopsacas minuta TaxID=111878 RepID=A0AAV7KDX2_9METZ|nr:Serine carboxypeptidase S10 family member 1-like [Oopsacas minuta]
MKLLIALALITLVSIYCDKTEAIINSYPWPGNVTQHTGYIVVNKTHGNNFFYWFFESRSKPSQDPLILWLTGGPGCSSSLALLAENGPFVMRNGAKQPVLNQYGWNSFANLLYVDQPVGTGFSYTNNPLGIETNEKTIARELTVFLEEFYQKFPKYASLPLFIIGESYAGHYVPAFSAYILQNSQIVTKNLKGIGIGNGWVDPKQQYPAYTEFMHDLGYITNAEYTVFNIAKDACLALIDAGSLVEAMDACSLYMEAVLKAAELHEKRSMNVYDVRIPCGSPPLCYDFSNVDAFLNSADVQAALGVNRSWTECNMGVHIALLGDWMKEFETSVALTLKKGVRVLVYSGKDDFICNYKGGLAWTGDMEWSGKAQFNAKSFTDWVFDGKKVAEYKTYSNFTFMEVENAGHMVPMDQPEVSLEMIRLFIKDKPFVEDIKRYKSLQYLNLF